MGRHPRRPPVIHWFWSAPCTVATPGRICNGCTWVFRHSCDGRSVQRPVEFDRAPCEGVSPQEGSPQDSPARAGARTVLDDGASTVIGSSAMTIWLEFTTASVDCRHNGDGVVADVVVSSMVVPRRVARQLNWQPAQWDQSQLNVPMATGVWPTTVEFTHP
jgi:hypothetical protein